MVFYSSRIEGVFKTRYALHPVSESYEEGGTLE